MVDRSAREKAVVELLDEWPWDAGGAIIGGYAVAAYGKPRYSEDVDIVLPRGAEGHVTNWLVGQQFHPEDAPNDWAQNYTGTFRRWKKGHVTIDLLVGSVRDRDAQVDIPEPWITSGSTKQRLILLDSSTRKDVPIIRKEAFWVLKLQSGRATDLGDLFAIHDQAFKSREVRECFQAHWCPTLKRKLAKVKLQLEDKKTYRDTLSRLELGSPEKPANKRTWENFKNAVARAMPPLEE